MQPKRIKTASPIEQAREQAEAYASLFAPTKLELGDGEYIMVPPHPEFGLLDDDRLEAYEELLFDMDTKYDREPDITFPETTLKDGTVLPGETRRGALKRPYRINGELVRPAHNVKVVIAALGEENYQKLRAHGKSAADVWRIWTKQNLEIQARQALDPKSFGSAVALESVPETDSE